MFLFNENKKISSIYLLYIISLIMNVVPIITISSIGAILLLVVFVATYIFKDQAEDDPIAFSHYSYLIKTIWIFSLFVAIGTIIAYFLGDHTIINNVVTSATNGVIMEKEQFSQELMKYANANKYVFGLIFTPVTLHLFYRLGKGLYKARKNLPIKNLKSWM